MSERLVKKWVYGGKEYLGEYSLRQAMFETTRKAFGPAPTEKDALVSFWANLGVTYTETEYIPTEAELKARAIRKRDLLLQESDYYVLADYPSTEEGLTEVKAYRQALRDITSQEGYPQAITWPTKPAVLGGSDE